MSAVLKALQTPRRREILRLVWSAERSAGEIHRAFDDVTFGAVSQHLRVLTDAGLVTQRMDGRHRYYSARKRELGGLRTWLESQWDSALSRLQVEAELEAARRGPRQKNTTQKSTTPKKTTRKKTTKKQSRPNPSRRSPSEQRDSR